MCVYLHVCTCVCTHTQGPGGWDDGISMQGAVCTRGLWGVTDRWPVWLNESETARMEHKETKAQAT